jgi:hypothetical protein
MKFPKKQKSNKRDPNAPQAETPKDSSEGKAARKAKTPARKRSQGPKHNIIKQEVYTHSRPAMSWTMAANLLLEVLAATMMNDKRLEKYSTPRTAHRDALNVVRSLGLGRTGELDEAIACAIIFFIRDDLANFNGTKLDAEMKFTRVLRKRLEALSDQDLANWAAADAKRLQRIGASSRDQIEADFIRRQLRNFRKMLSWCCRRAPTHRHLWRKSLTRS